MYLPQYLSVYWCILVFTCIYHCLLVYNGICHCILVYNGIIHCIFCILIILVYNAVYWCILVKLTYTDVYCIRNMTRQGIYSEILTLTKGVSNGKPQGNSQGQRLYLIRIIIPSSVSLRLEQGSIRWNTPSTRAKKMKS